MCSARVNSRYRRATASDMSIGPAVEEWCRALPQHGGAEPGGEPEQVGRLAEQDGARVADRSLPVRGDYQGVAPPTVIP